MKGRYQKAQLLSLLSEGNIRITTNLGEIDLRQLSCISKSGEDVYELPFTKVSVSVYEKGKDTVYRSVKLICKTSLTLYRIDFITDFIQIPSKFIEYKSFINAPAAAFVRYDFVGFYTGVENPFFSATAAGSEVCLSYEPSLLLESGEEYESEPQFLGC